MTNEVWVVDDHRLFNAGISRLLVTLSGIDKVRSFASPQEVLDLDAGGPSPRLIVSDFFMPGFQAEDWLPVFKQRFPGSPLVIISSSISSSDRQRCMQLGARAYFEKHLEPDIVLSGLQQLLDDDGADDIANTRVAEQLAGPALTSRQIEVLIWLARGLSSKAIAQELKISPETVKSHLKELYRALNVNGRVEAATWARERGLV